MKKTATLIILLLLVLSVGANAQMKSYLSLFAGESAPLGDFKSIDYKNNKAGFASKGLTFGLDGAFYIYKNLAIAGTLSFQDQGELSAANVYSIAYGYTSSFNADNSTTTGVNRYQSINLLIGPQYSFKITEKFAFDVRASAGFLKSISTPYLTTYLTGVPSQTATFYQQSSTALAFGYGGGLGLRYQFSDSFGLSLRSNYVNSSGYNITNLGRQVAVGRLVTKQPVSLIQTTLGINLTL
jgi:hypothetical protein